MKKLLFFSTSFLIGFGLLGTSKAEEIAQEALNAWLAHKPIQKLQLLSKKDDFLLIGLEPYLGRGNYAIESPINLRLSSHSKKLILSDSKGIIHKSSDINIGWKKLDLSAPKRISRKVVGPFSSFESAQQFSIKLNKLGIKSEIAHPNDWELWIHQKIIIPKEIKYKSFSKTIDFTIQPYLKGRNIDLRLSGPIQINAPGGLQWNKGVYFGSFLLKPDAYGTWTFIEKVSIDQYLNGVVPYEIGASSPGNALAAQAVLARTWALANSHRFGIDGYHLCSDTQCQVYKNPNQTNNAVRQAIQATSGKFLAWKGKPIHAVYHATNGGIMASANEAWSMNPVNYLKPKLDGSRQWENLFALPLQTNELVRNFLSYREGAYGNNHYRFRWKRTLTLNNLKKSLPFLREVNDLPINIKVVERGPSGRVLALEIVSSNKEFSEILYRDNIRRTFPQLPSTLFIINQLEEGIWEISGGGFGHGVGLSQAGAIDLALKGWSLNKILMHYYPGTDYETLP
tara:strand:- start:53024 stop:54556 length:1533 start_codon:yes stop_codon:yes gene_type:complete